PAGEPFVDEDLALAAALAGLLAVFPVAVNSGPGMVRNACTMACVPCRGCGARFHLCRVAGRGDGQKRFVHVGLLLSYVSELVRNEPVTGWRSGTILTFAKDQVWSCSIGSCLEGFGRSGCSRIVVYADMTEVESEVILHGLTGCRVQWLSGRAQRLLYE